MFDFLENYLHINTETHTWTHGLSQHSHRCVFNCSSWTRPEAFHQCQGRFENVLCQATLAGDVGCLKRATDLNMLKEALGTSMDRSLGEREAGKDGGKEERCILCVKGEQEVSRSL